MVDYDCQAWTNAANQTVQRCTEVIQEHGNGFPWWLFWILMLVVVIEGCLIVKD